MKLRLEISSANWADAKTRPGLGLLRREEWQASGADFHCLLYDEAMVTARCSVWLNRLPVLEGKQPAAIGHFEASDPAGGTALLHAVGERIRERHSGPIIGPIDGSTWRKYRLVTQSSGRPPFFLEPRHPEFYPQAWTDAGFAPLAEFHSASMPPQLSEDPRLERVQARMGTAGVRIRNLRMEQFYHDLRLLYSVARVSFAENLLYTPVCEKDFIAMYQPIRAQVHPELVWLAEKGSRCVGFCFCIPDLLQARDGAKIDSLIVKTLASLPDREFAGLGLWLTQLAHQAAGQMGYKTVVHALMHPGSRIKHFGKDRMEIFRRYTLFQKSPQVSGLPLQKHESRRTG